MTSKRSHIIQRASLNHTLLRHVLNSRLKSLHVASVKIFCKEISRKPIPIIDNTERKGPLDIFQCGRPLLQWVLELELVASFNTRS